MSNFFHSPKLIGLSSWIALCLSSPAQALWLNAYGSGEDEVGARQIIRQNSGGYIVTGQASVDNDIVNWYGFLDEQGTLKWSKTSGAVKVSADAKGGVRLQHEISQINLMTPVSATGKMDTATGAINAISVENNRTVSGNNGQMQLTDVANVYAGVWKVSDNNTDAVLTKVGADNQVIWSHRYDFSDKDSVPSIYPLNSGYLLVLNNYRYNEAGLSGEWTTVLARLDVEGNLVPGSTKQLKSGFGLYPLVLSDSSLVLSNHDFSGQIFVYKLDKQLNYVWGKRFSGADNADVIGNATVAEGVDGQLEMYPYRQRHNAAGQITGEHALAVVLDVNSGAVLGKNEINLRNFDTHPLVENEQGKFQVTGTVSDTLPTPQKNSGQDGVFALFNNTFQPEWVRTLAGKQHDQVEFMQKASGSSRYLLAGNTQSWGAGKSDLLFAKLDGNGAIPGCSAIAEMNPLVINANVSIADVASPITNAAVIDNGSVQIAVSAQASTFEFKPVDYAMVTTPICSAADPVEPVLTTATESNTGSATTPAKTNPETQTSATTPVAIQTVDPVKSDPDDKVESVTTPTVVKVTEVAKPTEPSTTTGTTVSVVTVGGGSATNSGASHTTPSPSVAEPVNVTTVSSETVNQDILKPTVMTKPELIVTPLAKTGVLKLSSDILVFGNAELKKPVTKPVLITNVGMGLLHIAEVIVGGDIFTQEADGCSGKVLQTGQGCELVFRFSPANPGLQNMTVSIVSDDPDHDKTSLVLQGVGINAPTNQTALARLSVSEASAGGLVTVSGKGFGKLTGKVSVGGKNASVSIWTDNRILFKLPTLSAGGHAVKITDKANKVLVGDLSIQIKGPTLKTVGVPKAAVAQKVSLSGDNFGSTKPKVYLAAGKVIKQATVLAGNTENSLTIKIPRLKSETYQLQVSNSAGSSLELQTLQIQ